MRTLAIFDEKNYQNTETVFEKYNVRGIIVRNGRLAMQCSSDGEYKIPGGGREAGESFLQTLVREIREETGLVVIENGVSELGEIIELRRDIFDDSKKYVCHSLFYYCTVNGEAVETALTASEVAKGYYLKWATPEEIYRTNSQKGRDPWIKRDTEFIRMLIDKEVILPEPVL